MEYKEKIEEKRQKLVNTLIEFIENNPTQWEAGWYKVATEPPFNGKSEKAYKGLNAFYLCVLSMLKGYRDPRWVTFKQAKELGGNVKSGEKSSEIFYWSFYDKATKKPYEEKTCEGMTKKERLEYWEKNVRPVIKFYQVFNAEQCENLPEYKRETTPEMEAEERQRQNAVIEQIIANSDAPVNYDGGNRAYYSPAEDSIHLPAIKDFKTMQDYYATALHEIAHSTGHESRLNRNLLSLFGTSEYAKEELRAELASVFMQVEYGISIEGKHFENHGAYLAGWLKSVKDNKNDFFAAATDAEKITGYIADNYLNAKSESKEQQQTTPKFEANTSFAKQVDAVLSGADTTSTHLKIMGTPLILRQLGAQNIPVLMTAKHLKNIVAESGDEKNVNYHGIDVDLIKKLPELLSDPVMVMDSLTRDDSVVIVTSAVDKENRPIIGAIKFDGFGNDDGEKISANILLSVYGRNHFNEFIQHNLNENTVLYWDKEKSQELIEIPGVQFPDSLNSLTTDIIIRKAKAFVNSLGEKNENIPVVEAKKPVKSTADVLERESSAKTFYLDYVKTQKENPEAIVLKRLGDFYEVMGDKAAQVAATLDLTLTGRDVGLSERVAMCGFPHHIADEYIAKLRESSDVIVDDKYLVKRRADSKDNANNENSVKGEKRFKIKSQVENWEDWYTDSIKNKRAREAAEWLIENNYENEDDVKSVFYDRQTSSMSDDFDAEKNDERAIIRVANEYKARQAQEQEMLEEARKAAHDAELPFSDKFDIGEEDFNPNVYDGSMSIEDYNLMNEMIASEQAEKVENTKKSNLYYPINEDAARRAKEANSFNDYISGSATKEYRQNVDKAKEIADFQKTQNNDIYGIVYNWKGLKEENSIYTANQLKELDEAFVPVEMYEGSFAANKTYSAFNLTGSSEDETLSNIRSFLTGKYNDNPMHEDWYWETVRTNLFTGEENATTNEYINQLNLTETEIRMSEQSEQAQQADTAEQVKQARQVGQAKWQKITIEPTLIGAERGKSTMLRMPEGEYSSFVLFVPTKFLQQDEKSGLVQLSVNDNFNYSLMKGNQRVELSGSELCQAMAGKEVGKRTQRVLSEANAENLTNIYRNIPEEMRQYPNWCVYRTRWNEEKGKYDKQIYSPVLGLNKDGKMQWASVDKPETWATFDVAMKFAEDNDCAGLVFALDGKTGISCIDLDKAIVKDGKLNDKPTDRADGEMSALALKLCNELKNTYIETSASGNGLHIFVKDDLLAKGTYKNRVETADGEIEVYDDKRFMSMTGKLRSNTQRLNKCPVATTAFLQSQLGEKTALQTAQPRQSRQVDNSDNAVIERIRRSKRGTEFDALYRGEDLTGDNSRNDFKMLNMLAFFTDCDESQMERIFKSSALYRAEKSDAYLQHSVKKACDTLQTRMSNRAYYGGNKKSGNNGNSK